MEEGCQHAVSDRECGPVRRHLFAPCLTLGQDAPSRRTSHACRAMDELFVRESRSLHCPPSAWAGLESTMEEKIPLQVKLDEPADCRRTEKHGS